MALKDLLKKKDKTRGDDGSASSTTNTTTTAAKPAQTRRRAPDIPEFTFVRTTTSTQETIEPPSFPGDPERYRSPPLLSPRDARSGFGIFRRQSNVAGGRSAPTTPTTPTSPAGAAAAAGEGDRKSSGGSSRLHFGRTRSSASANVPGDLPDVGGDGVARTEDEEARWETRATVLVMNGALVQGSSAPSSPALGREPASPMSPTRPGMGRKPSVAAPAAADEENIQEAIRLHEKGNLEASTALFGRLADPNGANNALAQVLYGLALRHAWGCEANQEEAVHFLSMAAANSAEVERLALGAGMKKGGAAKGELVLAMYELANCFRNGWGIKKDAAAAKHYYETAANLGDTDAMNEVAWCYIEGFGTKKDKFKAAQFLRLAESKGNKTLGNTWIWKPKYDPK